MADLEIDGAEDVRHNGSLATVMRSAAAHDHIKEEDAESRTLAFTVHNYRTSDWGIRNSVHTRKQADDAEARGRANFNPRL